MNSCHASSVMSPSSNLAFSSSAIGARSAPSTPLANACCNTDDSVLASPIFSVSWLNISSPMLRSFSALLMLPIYESMVSILSGPIAMSTVAESNFDFALPA